MKKRGMSFRLLFIVYIVLSKAFSAFTYAQDADEIQVGPIDLRHEVQGISVSIPTNAYFNIETKQGALHVRARVEGRLGDLQAKIGSIIDTIPLPRDNCASYKPDNLVASLPTKELRASSDSAVLYVAGNVEVWQCVENPIPKKSCAWYVRRIVGGFKTKVWECHTIGPGDPGKNKGASQSFEGTLPLYLRKTGDRSVALVLGDPNVDLKGQYAFITKGILKIAGVDINEELSKRLDRAIDPDSLAFAIPEEFADLQPIISKARFGEKDGVLYSFVTLSAQVPPDRINDFLRALMSEQQEGK